MRSLRSGLKRLGIALVVACILGAGLVLGSQRPAAACSPGYYFPFEFFLQAQTLEDLHDPDGLYAQHWADYWEPRDDLDPKPELRLITGVGLVHTVAEVAATNNSRPTAVLFGGVTVVQNAWGDFDDSVNPRAEPIRLNRSSCNDMNQLPEQRRDTWYLNEKTDHSEPRGSQLPTGELSHALTRLFGEPRVKERDLTHENKLIARTAAQLLEREDMTLEPPTRLNPATDQVEVWGATMADGPKAACAAGPFFLAFEHVVQASSLDDLTRDDGPFATDWQAWKREYGEGAEHENAPPDITGVAVVQSVGQIVAPSGPESQMLPDSRLRGVMALRSTWGSAPVVAGARRVVELSGSHGNFYADSCGWIPDVGTDVWIPAQRVAGPLVGFSGIEGLSQRAIEIELTRLFGDPQTYERDLDSERRLLSELVDELDEPSAYRKWQFGPVTTHWLNAESHEIGAWAASGASLPGVSFTG